MDTVAQSSRFLELWKVLFPNVIDRPQFDIPGKCETCYNIDNGRQYAASDFDSCAYVSCCLFLLANMCPVAFKGDFMPTFRESLCYWLLCEFIPDIR